MALGYFAANEAAERVEQRSAGAVAHRLPSFGHFGVAAKVAWRYGLPARVSFPGLMMDVDLWRGSAVMKDNDGPRQAAFVRQAGMRLSAYEHLVPEKLWTDAQHPGEAVSAVKALARAAAAGQKIYTLTSQNAAALAQIQIDDAARAEIGDALAAGKAVTVHESPVTVSGWTGSGYIVADPDSGAGAYKISGGANGAVLVLAGVFLLIVGGVGLLVSLENSWLRAGLSDQFELFASLAALGLGSIFYGLPLLFDDSSPVGQFLQSAGLSLIGSATFFLSRWAALVFAIIQAINAGLVSYWQNAFLVIEKHRRNFA